MLSRGHSGESVKDIQRALNAAGANPPLAVDGKLGPLTEAAIKGYQGKSGLDANGKVDATTLSSLQRPRTDDGDKMTDGPTTQGERRAPKADEKAPAGTQKAGDLARADDARRLGPGKDVPWYSQFDAEHVPDAGKVACLRATKSMAKDYGVKIGWDRVQVANAEDKEGRVETTRAQTDKARSYIDKELAAGRPVGVGVSTQDANYNADKITDHFVLITGKGTDEQGRTYYTYNDPGTNHRNLGQGQRFYVDENSGNLIHEGKASQGFVGKHSELSMVLKNEN